MSIQENSKTEWANRKISQVRRTVKEIQMKKMIEINSKIFVTIMKKNSSRSLFPLCIILSLCLCVLRRRWLYMYIMHNSHMQTNSSTIIPIIVNRGFHSLFIIIIIISVLALCYTYIYFSRCRFFFARSRSRLSSRSLVKPNVYVYRHFRLWCHHFSYPIQRRLHRKLVSLSTLFSLGTSLFFSSFISMLWHSHRCGRSQKSVWFVRLLIYDLSDQ